MTRANDHLSALREEVDRFRERETHKIVRHDNLHTAEDRWVEVTFTYEVLEPIPLHWGVIAGDILHNARSALDHLTWALAVLHSGPEPKGASKIGFPLFRDPIKFGKSTRELRKVFRDEDWTLIERLQPFNHPGYPGELVNSHPLWLLHEFSNSDKHRLLPVMQQLLHALDVEITPNPAGLHLHLLDDVLLEDGATIAWVRFPRPPESTEVEMHRRIAHEEAIPGTRTTPVVPFVNSLVNICLASTETAEALSAMIEDRTS